MFEIELPAAGSTPMNTPMADDRSTLTQRVAIALTAFQCSIFTAVAVFSISGALATFGSSTSLSSWLKANRPISTGR